MTADISGAGRGPHKQQRRLLLPLLWLATAALTGLLAWAVLSPVEVRVVALGEIVGEAEIVEIRAITSGVVEQLHVRNGQFVRTGDPLVSLHDNKLREQQRITRSKIRTLECRAVNTKAELLLLTEHESALRTATAAGELPEDLPLWDYRPVCLDESNVFRMKTLLETLGLIVERTRSTEERIRGLDAQIALLRRQLSSLRRDEKSARLLADRKFASEASLREVERAVDDKQLSVANLEANRHVQVGTLAELERQGQLTLSEHTAKLATSLDSYLLAVADEKVDLQDVELALEMRTIRAPVDGRVVNVNNFIVANFAQQSEVLLKVIPAFQLRLIKAHVAIGDIDNVEQEDAALVRFPTNAVLRDQLFEARIRNINPITTEGRPETGEVFYEVVLELVDEDYKPAANRIFNGTPVEIMFAAEETTVARALIRPVTRNWPRIFEQ